MRATVIETKFNAIARCKECNGSITVESRNQRKELIIHITYGPDSHTNTKLRRLTKAKAGALREQLKSASVHRVYGSQAKQIEM